MKWIDIETPIFPDTQAWGATASHTSYVITCDKGFEPSAAPELYGRYALSRKPWGRPREDIGIFDTLEQAKAAADHDRK